MHFIKDQSVHFWQNAARRSFQEFRKEKRVVHNDNIRFLRSLACPKKVFLFLVRVFQGKYAGISRHNLIYISVILPVKGKLVQFPRVRLEHPESNFQYEDSLGKLKFFTTEKVGKPSDTHVIFSSLQFLYAELTQSIRLEHRTKFRNVFLKYLVLKRFRIRRDENLLSRFYGMENGWQKVGNGLPYSRWGFDNYLAVFPEDSVTRPSILFCSGLSSRPLCELKIWEKSGMESAGIMSLSCV